MITYITEITDSNFQDFTKDNLVLIDIKAEWCGPCKALSPIIDEISTEYVGKLNVGKLDADMCPDTISSLGIRSIPTLLLFKDGEIVEKSVGMSGKQKIVDLIEKYI